MMYRRFLITDEDGKQVEFKVYPEQNSLVVDVKDEINMTMNTHHAKLEMITAASKFMSGNTINKVEIEEEE